MNSKTIINIIVYLLIGFLVIVALMAIFQNHLIFHPSSRMIDSPDRLDMPWSEHWIETSDGIRLHGWMIGEPDDKPVVVYSHGNAGNISGRVDIARQIANQGAAVFMYDYRGYGQSEGSPDEKGIYTDGTAVMEYVQNRLGISPGRVVYYGRSLGGTVAARQASEFGGAGLVLDAAFINGKEIASDIYPFIPRFLVRVEFPVDRYLRESDVGKVMIMHARTDRIIGFHHGEKLHEIASENNESTFVELDGTHNNSFNSSREIYNQSWKNFLEEIRKTQL